MESNDELEGRLRQHYVVRTNELQLPTMEFEDVVGISAVTLVAPQERNARRFAPWLAAAMLIATVGTVGLVMSRDAPSRKVTASTSTAPTATAPTASDFYDDVEQIRAAVNGTPERVGTLRQTKIHGCMAAAGYAYTIPPSELTTQIDYYRPGWDFRPDRDLAQQAGMGLWDETTNVAIGTFVAEDPAAGGLAGQIPYGEFLTQCVAMVDRTGTMVNPLAVPINTELGDLLLSTMLSDSFVPIEQHYGECMSRQGFAPQTPNIYDLAETLVYGEMVAADGLNRVDPAAPEFAAVQAQAKALDIKLSMADADCRAAQVDDAVDLLQPVFDAWLLKNQTRVDEAAMFWSTATPVASAESIKTFFDRIEAVFAALDGTAAQKSMLPYIQLRDCMATLGATYQLPLPADVFQPFSSPGYWHRRPDLGTARTYGFGYGNGIATTAFYTSPPPEGLSESDAAAYQQAFTTCGATVGYGPTSSGEIEVVRIEAPGRQLSSQLTGLMQQSTYLTADFEPINRRWSQCLSDRGFDVPTTTGIWDFAEEVVGIRGGQDPVLRHQVDVEFGVADAECRLAEADAVATILAPIFDEWISKNQAAVDAAGLFWTAQ